MIGAIGIPAAGAAVASTQPLQHERCPPLRRRLEGSGTEPPARMLPSACGSSELCARRLGRARPPAKLRRTSDEHAE